jgi:hypothetical protein
MSADSGGGHKLNEAAHKAYDSVRIEVLILYSILIDSGAPMKFVSMIKTYLNETHSKVVPGCRERGSLSIVSTIECLLERKRRFRSRKPR